VSLNNNSYQKVRFLSDTERTVTAAFTGVTQNIGTPLAFNPVTIIFDNQSTVDVAVSVDGGVTTWKTFRSNQSLVLDVRANHGNAPTLSYPVGTQFSLIATAGTGSFRISVNYAG